MPAVPTPRARVRTTAFVLALTPLTACGPGPANATADASTSTTIADATTTDAAPTTDNATADASTSTTIADATTDAAPTTGTDAGCLERAYPPKYAGIDQDPQWELGCGAPRLCPGDDPQVPAEHPLLFFIAGDPADPATVTSEDPARARCMIAALRDRAFGQLDFGVVALPDGNFLGRYGLELLGAQAITRAEPALCQLSCLTRERLRVLQAPDFFAACLDGDDRELWLCLRAAVVPEPACAPGPLPCP